MINFTYADAILKIRPGAIFTIHKNDYSSLNWIDLDQFIPSEEEILAAIESMKKEYDDNQYQFKRSIEYPSIGDQLDALFHAGMFPEEMAQRIQAVKDKYPKP
jgi:hypothetical protein